MDIYISKDSGVPLREQLGAQLEFLLVTRKLKPGGALPSVRALAKRLKIHHNTVSEAYQSLTEKGFLVRRRGSRMVVRSPEEPLRPPPSKDLDDLINETVKKARQHGYTLQQLRQRVRERMLEEPPDHILAVSNDIGMRALFRFELTEALGYAADSCSQDELVANPGLAIGALVVSAPGSLPEVVSTLPKDRTAIPIIFSEAKEHLEMVRQLRVPSLVAVVSISQYVLQIARGVLSPAIGRRHSICQHLLTGNSSRLPGAVDIAFCDWIAYRILRSQSKVDRIVPYRLISSECLQQISSMMPPSASPPAPVTP